MPKKLKENSKDFWKEPAYNLSGFFLDYLPKFIPKQLVYLLLISIPALIGYKLGGGIHGIWIAFWVVIWSLGIFFLLAYVWDSREDNWIVKAMKKLRPKKNKKKEN